MGQLQIFDKDGKALHIADVIVRLFNDVENEHNNEGYDYYTIQKYNDGTVSFVGRRRIPYETDDEVTLNAL